MNTVDVIYPSWPLFLYTNAAIGKSLIMPLLQYQTSGQYPNRWCAHDMGSLGGFLGISNRDLNIVAFCRLPLPQCNWAQ